jgi:hypothetical protein
MTTQAKLWSETSTGAGAYFRVDSVAVAKSDCKLAVAS